MNNIGQNNVRQPYGISILEQFMQLEDYAASINTLARNKLNKVASLQDCECISNTLDPTYPEYFRQLRDSYIKIYNALSGIENIINNVEL